MQVAERLYTSGFISYPRTETSQYAENADLKCVVLASLFFFFFNVFSPLRSVVRDLSNCSGSDWQALAKSLINDGLYTSPKRGKDAGDHPPITPVKAANSAAVGGGDYWRVYDYVCRHFIATVGRRSPCHSCSTSLFRSVPIVSTRRRPSSSKWPRRPSL